MKPLQNPSSTGPTRPLATSHFRRWIVDAFEDVALAISGLSQSHQASEVLIWALLRRLKRIRNRLLRLLDQGPESVSLSPNWNQPRPIHPAVEEFLKENRRISLEMREVL